MEQCFCKAWPSSSFIFNAHSNINEVLSSSVTPFEKVWTLAAPCWWFLTHMLLHTVPEFLCMIFFFLCRHRERSFKRVWKPWEILFAITAAWHLPNSLNHLWFTTVWRTQAQPFSPSASYKPSYLWRRWVGIWPCQSRPLINQNGHMAASFTYSVGTNGFIKLIRSGASKPVNI